MARDDASTVSIPVVLDDVYSEDGVIYNADAAVGPWVAKLLGPPYELPAAGRYTALGVMRDRKLIAGVIYEARGDQGVAVECSIASTSPTWATRPVLRRLFRHAFERGRRITALVSSNNVNSTVACLKMGFQLEGRCAMSWPTDGSDTLIFRMFEFECPWLEPEDRSYG